MESYGYSTTKKKIHEYVDQADDRFLTLITGMIEADKSGDWWDELHPNLKVSLDRALEQSKKGRDVHMTR